MIAVLFEATLRPGAQARYLQLAALLKPRLADNAGFIAIERFRSLADDQRLLSLSWWRDEESVLAWKQDLQHQAAQEEGHATLFASWRIHVVRNLRDYSSTQRG